MTVSKMFEDQQLRFAAELRSLANAIDNHQAVGLSSHERHEMRGIYDNWAHLAAEECVDETVMIKVKLLHCRRHGDEQ